MQRRGARRVDDEHRDGFGRRWLVAADAQILASRCAGGAPGLARAAQSLPGCRGAQRVDQIQARPRRAADPRAKPAGDRGGCGRVDSAPARPGLRLVEARRPSPAISSGAEQPCRDRGRGWPLARGSPNGSASTGLCRRVGGLVVGWLAGRRGLRGGGSGAASGGASAGDCAASRRRGLLFGGPGSASRAAQARAARRRSRGSAGWRATLARSSAADRARRVQRVPRRARRTADAEGSGCRRHERRQHLVARHERGPPVVRAHRVRRRRRAAPAARRGRGPGP